MIEIMTKSQMSAVSALALTLAWSGAALAEPVAEAGIAGFSRDGSIYLIKSGSSVARSSDSNIAVTVVSTITGVATKIPLPDGIEYATAYLSADGKTVVGEYYDYDEDTRSAYSWTAMGGLVTFGSEDRFSVTGVSDNGTIVGYGYDGSSYFAAIWINGEFIKAPTSSTFGETAALAISRDSSTVVGSAVLASGDYYAHAMVWDLASNQIENIDTLDYKQSRATHVSSDGSVAAGIGYDNTWTGRVFRWTSSGGTKEIGSLVDDGYMYLNAMSDDGDVLVGYGETSLGYDHAYRYVASASTNNLTDLGTLGGNNSAASDVSADGKYVVGQAEDSNFVNHGFRWEESTGMLSIEQWLAASGVAAGYSTSTAEYISDDGKVVIGMTDDYAIYVARLGGIIKQEEFFPAVVQVGSSAVQNGVSSANTIMFGAQGNPMRNLLGAGERSAWGTVDAGYDNGDTSKGGLALGEFGIGYGILDGVTARFSVGGTYTKQDLDTGGWVKQEGYYLSPELSANVASNLYVTFGGYYSRTNIDTARGYLNGSSQDYSNGSTGADTWGAKLRLDWLNAANVANTDITPYAGLSYARTTVDAYTENSGSFPVSYDEMSDHSTIARIGADFVRPMSDTVRMLAKTEVSYQFEGHAAATSGTLTGVSDFNIDGQDLKQFWVRGGIGAEFDVGGGTASFMVNATTQGQDPTVWLRSNYTVKF
ncbi:autotransporter domain-containing protein [uncultured Agrobacterium sp.]|uniref:autotransporter domain-containing protein n=1 Tax=uncultured Agrobacterium sp. TaxID=157277 RepID=UPI0025829000|nr:autotransporter domain-containing protein [uncultured Agrobacterium sp.]